MLARLALAALACAAALPLHAQQGGGMGAGRGQMNMLAMEAPLDAETFAKTMGLDAAQTARYARLRQAYLDETRVERDSVAVMRARMRIRRDSMGGAGAGQMGAGAGQMRGGEGRMGGGGPMGGMRTLMDTLNARYTDFENDLKFLLTAEQYARYEEWKVAERQRRMEQMREERRQRAG